MNAKAAGRTLKDYRWFLLLIAAGAGLIIGKQYVDHLPENTDVAGAFIGMLGVVFSFLESRHKKGVKEISANVLLGLAERQGVLNDQHEQLVSAVQANKAECDATAIRVEHAEKRLDNHDAHLQKISPALKQVAEKVGVRYEPVPVLVGRTTG